MGFIKKLFRKKKKEDKVNKHNEFLIKEYEAKRILHIGSTNDSKI